jgi:hypothetical protein
MMDKPSQILAINRIWETLDAPHRQLIECFAKKEPCKKTPRVISSFADARYLVGFSRFTLACRDRVLHDERHQHWFYPGSDPPTIVKRLQDFATDAPDLAEGDYANMDGTVSMWLQRNVMNAIYHRYFMPEYWEELTGYTGMLISCPARAKSFGFQYDAGVGVKSGSPTTCDLNTVLNAFVSYCGVRMTYPHLSKEDAFAAIGPCFGDDGLMDATFASKTAKAAKALGLTLKVERVRPRPARCSWHASSLIWSIPPRRSRTPSVHSGNCT